MNSKKPPLPSKFSSCTKSILNKWRKISFMLMLIHVNLMRVFFYLNTLFLNKQLGLGPNPQRCLYFQHFQGSKLLSSCLAVWPNKHFSCVFPRFLVTHFISFSDCSKKFLLNSKLLLCFVALVQQCKLECNL